VVCAGRGREQAQEFARTGRRRQLGGARGRSVHAVLGAGAGADEVAAGAADVDARGQSARRVGDDHVGRSGQPQVTAAARGQHDHRLRDREQVAQGQFAQGGRGVRTGFGVEVDADEAVRVEAAGDAVAGRPGRGGEERADAAGVGGGVVHAVSEAAAFAVAGSGRRVGIGVVAVGGAQGRELRAGQRDHREAAFGGGQGVGQGQGRGLPVDGGHASMFVRVFEKGKGLPGAGVSRRGFREDWPKSGGTVPLLGRPGSSCPIRSELGFLVMKRVYRHVLTLEGESRLPGWFAGDSVGNSGLATS
jgi:hypothetical protein